VYIAQYTAEPLLSEDRSRPRHLAEVASHERCKRLWAQAPE
jgi:hypothetical protein